MNYIYYPTYLLVGRHWSNVNSSQNLLFKKYSMIIIITSPPP